MKTKEFVHPVLNEEVEAIGGVYVVEREERMEFDGKVVLYLICWAMVDRSCCGVGGCAYALVPGFVSRYKSRMNEEGFHVSEVVPIGDLSDQKAIKCLIEETATVQQVIFQS